MDRTNAPRGLSECIVQSLLLLLQDQSIDEISVKEIVEKAGVNRSTYYRHFSSKQDVVRRFYQLRLDEYLSRVSPNTSAQDYFTGMFESFLRYKKELILLDRRGLSVFLLAELNTRIAQVHGNNKAAAHSLACNYHIGGVFNSFRYWLFEEMETPPDQLARQCLLFLPRDFCPYLLQTDGAAKPSRKL